MLHSLAGCLEPVLQTFTVSTQLWSPKAWLGLLYLPECFDTHVRRVSLNVDFGVVLVQIYSLLKKSVFS